MNNPQDSIAAANAMLNALTALFNAGGAGSILYYTGTQRATPDASLSGNTLLCTDTFSSTSFGAAASKTATANSITSGVAVATGTVTWAALVSNAGTGILDLAVGATATGTAVVTSNAVTSVTVANGGGGYGSTPPTVAFSGGGGSGATATAVLTGGVVTSVTIGAGGSGYTSTPTVTFSATPSDIIISNISVASGTTISVSSLTISHP